MHGEGQGLLILESVAHALGLGEHVVTFIMIALLILIAGAAYLVKIRRVENIIIPDEGITFRNIIEAFGSFIYSQAKSNLGEEEARRHYPFLAMLFLFIFSSNVIGLIPGFLPPTDNLNTTLAMGVFVFFYYNYQGIREHGFFKYMKHFIGPVWYLIILFFPLEIISHIIRPLSLSLRLRGNIYGDHVLLSIFSDLVPYALPAFFLAFGLFICFIQAFVFTLLTMVYINLSTSHTEEEHH